MDGLGADVSFSKIALLPITGTTYRVRVRVALVTLSTAIWLYAVRLTSMSSLEGRPGREVDLD